MYRYIEPSKRVPGVNYGAPGGGTVSGLKPVSSLRMDLPLLGVVVAVVLITIFLFSLRK